MGLCEEDGVSGHENMMDREKTVFPKMPHFQKNKAGRYMIAVLILVIIVLLVALVTVSTRTEIKNEIKNEKSAPCDDDWIWYRGKCYFFSTERDTWRNSQKFCNSHEASLAIIENKEELDFLFQCKGTDNRWIGIRRTDDNTAWMWTNGKSYNESVFTISRQSENSGKIEYVFLNHEAVRSQEGPYENKWICNKT